MKRHRPVYGNIAGYGPTLETKKPVFTLAIMETFFQKRKNRRAEMKRNQIDGTRQVRLIENPFRYLKTRISSPTTFPFWYFLNSTIMRWFKKQFIKLHLEITQHLNVYVNGSLLKIIENCDKEHGQFVSTHFRQKFQT